MLKVPLKVLVAVVATLLALGLWWGFVAVSRSLGLTGGWIEEWSIVGWIAYGLLTVGLYHVLENLVLSSVGGDEPAASREDPDAPPRKRYAPGMWGKGGSTAGDSDFRS